MLEVAGIDTFYGKAHVLRGLSLTVPRGHVVALLGRNGAGKTTTMKSVMQLVRPASGTITFEGQPIGHLPSHRIAKLGLGYVPEERRIFTDLTVSENLLVGRQPPREGAPTWTEEMLFELFPNLAERRGNRGKALSGGEQQMLSIARTLMGNPRLLLLDEPSEGIAPVIVEQLATVILRLKSEGLPVLLSEQNLHFARIVSDRAVIIESGAVRIDIVPGRQAARRSGFSGQARAQQCVRHDRRQRANAHRRQLDEAFHEAPVDPVLPAPQQRRFDSPAKFLGQRALPPERDQLEVIALRPERLAHPATQRRPQVPVQHGCGAHCKNAGLGPWCKPHVGTIANRK